MYRKAFKFFLTAFILWLILIGLIYLGSYLRYMISGGSWHQNATIISLLFVWVTIFTITVVVTMKGVVTIKEHLKAKMRLDFLAWLGMLTIDYYRSNPSMDIYAFFKSICEENGIKNIPDFSRFYDSKKNLNLQRNNIFETIRKEIEETANEWSNQPIKK